MKKNYNLALSPICCAVISVLVSSQAVAAANFSINPASGSTLPTLVYPGASVSAYYTIINQTGSQRTGYVIQGLPATATQNTSGTNNCQSSITLAAHGNCTLQIDIKGAVKTGFALCKGSSCTTASVPLNVSLASSPPPMIAAGAYVNTLMATDPLLAHRGNGGLIWAYPSSVISALPTGFTGGSFYTASCSGNNCIAGGDEVSLSSPLLGHSADGGLTWDYPLTITSALPSDFQAITYSYDYGPAVSAINGFNSTSCSGSICIAVGSYKPTVSGSPYFTSLLAQSTDGGGFWSYPNISNGAPSEISGKSVFWGVSCSGSTCVAVGEDYDGNNFIPLLAQSTNGGGWSYPQTAITQNPNYGTINHDSLSIFYGVSCSGSTCVAVGDYYNFTAGNPFPLLAQSSDSGLTWAYPSSITTDFISINNSSLTADVNVFTSVSCNQNNCVAAGYGQGAGTRYPLLAQSTNGGTWNYTINYNTPNNLSPHFSSSISSQFNSVSCSPSLCVAVGNDSNNTPLLGQSTNNGVTWTYPTISSTPPGLVTGFFNSVSCTGTVCVAAGQYNDGTDKPLLAQTDDGVLWYYPSSVIDVLPSNFGSGGFNGTSVGSATLLPESLQFIQWESKATQ